MSGRRAEQRARFAAAFDEVRLDTRAALYALTSAPGFAITAVVTLTIAADIRRLVLREEMAPVALGFPVGLALSFAVNRVLESQLVGVSPYDPATLLMTSTVLIVVALFACQIPARRALRVDPVVALRND